MGVTGLLSRVSQILHRIDVRDIRCRGGRRRERIVHDRHSAKRRKRSDDDDVDDTTDYDNHDGDSRIDDDNNNNYEDDNHHDNDDDDDLEASSGLRIAVDISTWIYREFHGNGARLLDERSFTNHGRAEMMNKNKNTNMAISKVNIKSSSTSSSSLNNDDHQQQSRETITIDDDNNNDEEYNNEEERKRSAFLDDAFVRDISRSVVRKMISLRDSCEPSCEVIAVFDGATPPAKRTCVARRREIKDQQAERQKRIEEESAQQHQQQQEERDKRKDNNDTDSEGLEEEIRNDARNISRMKAARRAVSHPLMSRVVDATIATMRSEQIPFLVAPYEADGQLVFLQKHMEAVDLVISDDGDLIGHGATAILFRAKENGGGNYERGGGRSFEGYLYLRRNVGASPFSRDGNSSKRGIELLNFSDVMLATMMVAAGCDYCDSLPGIGVVKARDAVKEAFQPEDKKKERTSVLPKIFRLLRNKSYSRKSVKGKKHHENNGNSCNGVHKCMKDDEYYHDYESRFLRALVMYRHPIVFDPSSGGQCVHANIAHPDHDLMQHKPYADLIQINDSHTSGERSILRRMDDEATGRPFCQDVGIAVAEGWINPRSWELRGNGGAEMINGSGGSGGVAKANNIPESAVRAFEREKTRIRKLSEKRNEAEDNKREEIVTENKKDEERLSPRHRGDNNISEGAVPPQLSSSTITTETTGTRSQPSQQSGSSGGSSSINLSPDLLLSHSLQKQGQPSVQNNNRSLSSSMDIIDLTQDDNDDSIYESEGDICSVGLKDELT